MTNQWSRHDQDVNLNSTQSELLLDRQLSPEASQNTTKRKTSKERARESKKERENDLRHRRRRREMAGHWDR